MRLFSIFCRFIRYRYFKFSRVLYWIRHSAVFYNTNFCSSIIIYF